MRKFFESVRIFLGESGGFFCHVRCARDISTILLKNCKYVLQSCRRVGKFSWVRGISGERLGGFSGT